MTVGIWRESRGSVRHDRRVDNAEPFGTVDASGHIDDGAIVGPWAHRAGPDDVGEGVGVRCGSGPLARRRHEFRVRAGRRTGAGSPVGWRPHALVDSPLQVARCQMDRAGWGARFGAARWDRPSAAGRLLSSGASGARRRSRRSGDHRAGLTARASGPALRRSKPRHYETWRRNAGSGRCETGPRYPQSMSTPA